MYRKEQLKKNREYRRRQRRAYRLATAAGCASIAMTIVSVFAVGFRAIDPVRGLLFIGVFGIMAAVCSAFVLAEEVQK